ncbi:MFS transporter [Nonomuraea recticatena]|uniref:hypothetical protein n=1 Tax=Nonomuraea recticatena TaxID=46178 RepID=UPI0036179028
MENTLVRDWRGRAYLVTAPPSDRRRMFVLAWASMIAIAPLQYGYAAAVPAFLAGGRSLATVLLPLAAWIVCQAVTAFLLSTRLPGPRPSGGVTPPLPAGTSPRDDLATDPTSIATQAAGTRRDDRNGGGRATENPDHEDVHRRGDRDRGNRRRVTRSRDTRDWDRGREGSASPDRGPRVGRVLGAGAGLSGIGLLTVAISGELWALLIGFSLLGGVGGGLVYGVCSRLVAGWYPERSAARVGYVTGAFGYGALPVAIVAGMTVGAGDARSNEPDGAGDGGAGALTPGAGDGSLGALTAGIGDGGAGALAVAFAVCAVVAVVAIGLAARFVRLAPPRWWPDTIDPRHFALDARHLRRTPPAVREFTPGQALRTPALAVLAGILLCAGAISIFNVVVVAAMGSWVALALLIALNGAGRAGAMRVSELLGRRRTLALVLAVLGVGQVVLASGAVTVGAMVAGLGGGGFYPLVAALVREYFGEERVTEIHGVVYSAKAVAGIVGVGLAGVLLAGSAVLAGGSVVVTRGAEQEWWMKAVPRVGLRWPLKVSRRARLGRSLKADRRARIGRSPKVNRPAKPGWPPRVSRRAGIGRSPKVSHQAGLEWPLIPRLGFTCWVTSDCRAGQGWVGSAWWRDARRSLRLRRAWGCGYRAGPPRSPCDGVAGPGSPSTSRLTKVAGLGEPSRPV